MFAHSNTSTTRCIFGCIACNDGLKSIRKRVNEEREDLSSDAAIDTEAFPLVSEKLYEYR